MRTGDKKTGVSCAQCASLKGTSEVGGVRPVGPPIGKSFRFVSCVRARGAGEVAAECFWDPTAQWFACVLLGF